MKILTVYYSRAGSTRLVAEKIAQWMHTDLEELKERKDRRGLRGYIAGGRRQAPGYVQADVQPA